MTRVIIVGDVYYADLYPGGGPMPGGPGRPVDPSWGVRPPVDPGYGRPGWSPVDPGYGRPGWSPVDPGYGRPDYAPGHPGGGPMPGGPNIDNTLPGIMPQGGTEVPPDIMPPPPVPEEIASQYIVSVYNPKTMTWTTKSYPPR